MDTVIVREYTGLFDKINRFRSFFLQFFFFYKTWDWQSCGFYYGMTIFLLFIYKIKTLLGFLRCRNGFDIMKIVLEIVKSSIVI